MGNFFSSFFDKLNKSNITINIIGDVLIDEYYQVEVDRISPEFPIPIHCSVTDKPHKVLCGGAANVVMQFRNFNIKTNLISLISPETQDICELNGIDTKYSIVSKDVKNPIKKRFYKDFHPLTRWDIEQPNFGLLDISRYLSDIKIPDSDINIFSDYDKGLFSTNWHKNYLKQSKSLVDPKKNLNIWEGCYLFKPNSVEAKRFVNKEKVEDQLKWLQALLGCDNVVITNAGEGVSAIDHNEKIYYVIPDKKSIKPENLTGAGDAYIAFLAMALSAGIDLQEAIAIAFEAGTKYVANRYNKPLNPSDFFVKDKLITNPAVLRNRDFNLVWTNGCMDLTHFGHISSLKQAKSFGDKLCVGINSDESIAKLKGEKRPIIPLGQRIEMLKAIECVDFIVVLEEEFPQSVIEAIKPNVLVKGEDWRGKNIAGANVVDRIEFIPLVEGLSTTNIINKIIHAYG
jgi:D-beta-D-heptose 7-phosphate kinase/D-beta-D-heptose 1-phosphate adenosyltransferase